MKIDAPVLRALARAIAYCKEQAEAYAPESREFQAWRNEASQYHRLLKALKPSPSKVNGRPN